MKNVSIIVSIFFLFCGLFVVQGWAQNLDVVTEQYPPYNYEEDGKGRIQRMGEVIVKMIVLCVTFSDLINNV